MSKELIGKRTSNSKTYDLGNGKRQLVVSISKGHIKVDPTWQVGASTDDCYRRLTAPQWFLTFGYQVAGGYDANYYQRGGGMRFTGITIPQGTTIDDGTHLTLRCNLATNGTVVRSRISAEDVDDAPTFVNDGDVFDTRWAARTTARVDWDAIPAWTKDVDYNSPEIKTVIQEIVDRGGWASGQDIVIFWEDFEDRSTHASGCYRAAYSYNGSTTYAPKLVIDYTVVTEKTSSDTGSGAGTLTAVGLFGSDVGYCGEVLEG